MLIFIKKILFVGLSVSIGYYLLRVLNKKAKEEQKIIEKEFKDNTCKVLYKIFEEFKEESLELNKKDILKGKLEIINIVLPNIIRIELLLRKKKASFVSKKINVLYSQKNEMKCKSFEEEISWDNVPKVNRDEFIIENNKTIAYILFEKGDDNECMEKD